MAILKFKVLLAVAVVACLALAKGSYGFGRSLLQTCKRSGERCSLYAKSQCCTGLVCTMPLECTLVGDRRECVPECRKQTLSSLTRIQYPSSSGTTPGFEGGKRTRPAVVVMQEWWGVNDAIKETALHIAEQGYRVLIPDLYRGRVAVERMEAIGLSSDLNWTRGIDDVVKAVEYLRATGSVKVAIIGFCQGGGMALCGAEFARVDAAIPFYGIPSAFTGCNPVRIPHTVPIQAHFGTNDTAFPIATRVLPLVNSMLAAGVNIRLNLYEGLPHAFFNAITPAGRTLLANGDPSFIFPNETLVTLAFSRLTNFLRLYIR